MKKKAKVLIVSLVFIISVVSMSGCAIIGSKFNDFKGDLLGNKFTIYTYDNYGTKVLESSGKKINIEGNTVKRESSDSEGNVITSSELTSVITINIDGNQIQSCGDTCIFVEKGLDAEVDFNQKMIESGKSNLLDATAITGFVNKYKNYFGKSRIVVIKSQMGQPIVAYSGDDVYWEIPEDLPKMTKLMIDGKALYIHRANFQIIDKACLK